MKDGASAAGEVGPRCAGCARDLRLVGIELDIVDRRCEIHTFECDNCNEIQIKTSIQILAQRF